MEKKKNLLKKAILASIVLGYCISLRRRNKNLREENVGLRNQNECLRDLNKGLQRSVQSQAFGLGKLYGRSFRNNNV